jgi:4-hydroxybenzoate polyprenyltransferase
MTAFLHLVRFPLVFTAVADAWAGAFLVQSRAVAADGPSLSLDLFALFLFSLLPALLYAGGMALNDRVDLERDRKGHPHRPLPSGKLSPRQADLLIGALWGLAGVVALLVSLATLGWALLLMGGIGFYNFWAKHCPAAAALTLGGCRGLNLFMGMWVFWDGVWMRAPGAGLGSLWWAPFILFLYVGAITYLSTWEERRPEIARVVRYGLLGIIPLDALLALCGGSPAGGVVILLLFIPRLLFAWWIPVN